MNEDAFKDFKEDWALSRLNLACQRSGTTMEKLLQQPLPEIIAFGELDGIMLDELVKIVSVLIQRLEELDRILLERQPVC